MRRRVNVGAMPDLVLGAITLSDALTAVGILVGVAAIVAGIFAARRWGNRRKRVLFDWRSAPLITHNAPHLKVTFRDIEVSDPHLVILRLRNIGPADVASEHFDASRPVVIRLNCTMYGVTSATHPQATVSTAVGADGVVQMEPHLLRRAEEWIVEAVVAGSPDPILESSLIDTDIVDAPSYSSELARGAGRVFIEAAARSLRL